MNGGKLQVPITRYDLIDVLRRAMSNSGGRKSPVGQETVMVGGYHFHYGTFACVVFGVSGSKST